MQLILPLSLIALAWVQVQGAPAPSRCILLTAAQESATVSTSAPVSSATTNPASGEAPSGILSSGWLASWDIDSAGLETISWDKYDLMTMAFGLLDGTDEIVSLDDVTKALLPDFVSTAKANNVTALLSLGGWTGSLRFSEAVATPDNRTAFVAKTLSLVDEYGLDGIDFDWEYPNAASGMPCNTNSPDDTANFLSFLQELRADDKGKDLTLTAAVATKPFNDENQVPSSDVSAFAEVFDHIAIMVYDVFGGFSANVGPNAPLDDSCAPADQQLASAVNAVDAWTNAGFPANQIALAVASYGRSFTVPEASAFSPNNSSELAAFPSFTAIPNGPSDTDAFSNELDACGIPNGVSGIWYFNEMVEQGLLTAAGEPNTGAGMVYQFDQCSQTPFLYDPSQQLMVSYDDRASFTAKRSFIEEKGLKGFAMWYITGDEDDILVDTISGR